MIRDTRTDDVFDDDQLEIICQSIGVIKGDGSEWHEVKRKR